MAIIVKFMSRFSMKVDNKDINKNFWFFSYNNEIKTPKFKKHVLA